MPSARPKSIRPQAAQAARFLARPGLRASTAMFKPVVAVGNRAWGLTGQITGRAMDVILRGPLVEAIAREVAHHAVVERTLTEILDATTSAGPPAQRRAVAGVELERAARAALDSGRMQQAIARALESADADELIGTILESPLLDSVVDHLLASEALWRLVEEIVASPAVMAAISQQGLGFIDQVGEETRRRSRRADAWLEEVARRLAHRRPNSLAASGHQSRDDPEQ